MGARVLASARPPTPRILRHSGWDVLLIALSACYGVALITMPSIPLIAIGFWWTSNTVAHNFIHLPFFRSRMLNRGYSGYLSLILGVPQSIWRERHLAHHAGSRWRRRLTLNIAVETALVLALWTSLFVISPSGFLLTYLPGCAMGLLLCHLQGRFEHVRGTTSYYGRIYNLLFFNDGYHVEHHERPSSHWLGLRDCRQEGGVASRWPPVLRWLDYVSLDGLERVVVRSSWLQRFVLASHERAFNRLLPTVGQLHAVTIIGGGLFPRTALVLRRLLPQARLTVVDADSQHLATAAGFLDDSVICKHEMFDPTAHGDADLLVAPLAYRGDRRMLYSEPPAGAVLVHDWIWRSRGRSTVISWLLLKRLNLVHRVTR